MHPIESMRDRHLLPRLLRYERGLVLRALRCAGGSLRGAAKALGCGESTLRARARSGGYETDIRRLRSDLRTKSQPPDIAVD